jgi:PAS domain S-box-containing protein
LSIAARLTSTLHELHQRGVVHQNVRPPNILLYEGGEVELIGSAAALGPAWFESLAELANAPEAPPYLAPEQTGHISLPIDNRTDLYSLGIVLYEMLSGKRPFEAADIVGWLHSHIARPPRPLREAAPETEAAIADIVMKLLAKAPDDRYQTARGLLADLERCLFELERSGRIEPFPLGSRDIWNKIRIPSKLYGREREVTTLLQAFERALASGSSELVLVYGYSGIGKSMLVRAIEEPIVRASGLFLAGKFQQYSQTTPYATIAQAFRRLVSQILGESDARLNQWKNDLYEALGSNGRIITEVLPSMELILGEQPPVPPLPPSDAASRLHMVFRRFIGVFAKPEHPLVLFLDDLQWADLASLKLLQHILAHADAQHLLILGAYRDNEVSPSHPLVTALDDIRKTGTRVTPLSLGPLSQADAERLVADAIHCDVERAAPLAELVWRKTGGNPFFLTQLLLELERERLVRFDTADSVFQWDIEEIRAKSYTENVVEFMVFKLRRLPGEAQDALRVAACIGNEFEIQVLAILRESTEERVTAEISAAVREGLVVPRRAAYKFLHDRVQEAAYLLTPEEDRPLLHLKIGRLLLARVPAAELDDWLFDITNQLNIGAALISSADERRTLAELNLRAGARAKASSAHKSAAGFFSAGFRMLPEDGSDYALAYALTIELAESECLNGNFERAERLCEEVLARAATKIDKTAAYRIKIQTRLATGESRQAIEIGIECLRHFGIELSCDPSEGDVLAAFDRVFEILQGRRVADLLDLPRLTDPDVIAPIETLADIFPPAYYISPELTDLIVANMVMLSITHGNTGASVIAYGAFGVALIKRFNRYDDAFQFGKIAYELVERHGYISLKAQACNYFGPFISIWTEHINFGIRYTRIGIDAAIETGNAVYGVFNTMMLIWGSLLRGDSLQAVYKETLSSLDYMAKVNFLSLSDLVAGAQRLIRNLEGRTSSFSTYDESGFDAGALEQRVRESGPAVVAGYFIFKLKARFFSGDYAEAMEAAKTAQDFLWAVYPMPLSVEYYFFAALTAAYHFNDAPEGERPRCRALLTEHRDKLRLWSESCPDNFLDMYLLVSAEIARIEGRDMDAVKLYDQAIKASRQSGFTQNEALINELAARFYLARGVEATAPAAHLEQARACYERWGAYGKVRQLERLYPRLLAPAPDKEEAAAAGLTELDVLAVTKVYQALSSEIVLDKLLATLLRLVVEHSGAQRGWLLLPREHDLTVAADAEADHQGIHVRVHDLSAPAASSAAPLSFIHYIIRTREPLILDNVSARAMFSMDEYIAAHRPRSLLGAPIARHSKLVGVLCLENNLASGVFHERHTKLLEVLSTQAAISIENAGLYARLETENAERLQAEKTLRRSDERLRRLIETASVVPWEWSPSSRRFIYVGPQAVKMLGHPEREWYKDDFLPSLVHELDRGGVLRRFAEVGLDVLDDSSAERDDFELRVVTADRRVVWLRNIASARRTEDGSIVVSGFWFDITERKEIEAILKERLDTIEQQKEAIRTLSTPVIEVWDGVLTMPLYGKIDSGRVQQMMEVLLNRVVRTRSRYTIIDLTGVEEIDAETADAILKLVEAVKLLGAQGIVVGIQANVASMIVSIGAQLTGVRTLANLREALLACIGGPHR